MRIYTVIFFAFVMFMGCTEEDVYTWEYEKFAEDVLPKQTKLVEEVDENDLYAYFNFKIVLNTEKYYSKDDDIEYSIKYDSITASINGNMIELEYRDLSKYVNLKTKQAVEYSGTIEFTVWGSWYYNDNSNTQFNYTDGDPVFIETISESFNKQIESEIPFKAFNGVIEDKFINSVFYLPEVELNYKPFEELEHAGINYKYEIRTCLLNDGESKNELLYNLSSNGTLTILSELDLNKNVEYKFSIIADWYVETSFDEWETNGVFQETFDIESNPNESIVFEFTLNDFETLYPLNKQCNYLQAEYQKGYFRVKNNTLRNYFEKNKLFARIINNKIGDSISSPITYNSTLNVFEYDLPASFLGNKTIYRIELYEQLSTDNLVLTYFFRTSFYNSFEAKLQGEKCLASYENNWNSLVKLDGNSLGYTFGFNIWSKHESFDTYESVNNVKVNNRLPLIRFESISFPQIMDNTYEKSFYSTNNNPISRKGSDIIWSEPPLNAIYFNGRSYLLTDNNINGSEVEMYENCVWEYYVTGLASKDCYLANGLELKNQKNVLTNFEASGLNVIEFPPLNISYVLPGIEIVTTSIENYEISGWEDVEK